MSKAPKTKRTAIHYQPYQALSQSNENNDEQSIDTNISDIPLDLDPVLTGLSSNMSRNLWDDWNEHDANFGMKFDMYTDAVSTTSSPASSNLNLHVDTSGTSLGYEQEQNVSLNHQTLGGVTTSTLETKQKPRADVERSLSEDIVKMLNDTNETMFSKQLDADQRSSGAMQGMSFNPGQNMMGNQQHMQQFQQQQMQMKMEFQLQLQQQQQQQYRQQEQQFQQTPAVPNASSWMNSFGGGTQFNAATSTSASGKPSNHSAHRHQSHPASSTAFGVAAAEGAALLTAQCPASRVPATSSSCVSTTAQHASNLNSASEKLGLARTHSGTPSPSSASSEDASVANKTNNADTDPSNSNATQANGFGAQGMMMNPFMMYPMMVPQTMNMMGMPMQIPMGMNVNGMNSMNGMNGLPLPMQLQMQLQLQMQMAQMAQMNGMGGMNGMQMPMGLPGMSMGMNMQMPLNMNMQQQQQQQQQRVNPQSGLSGDIEMIPAFSMGMSAAGGPMLKPAKALQPKGVGGGPGFVNIARKPEEPEVSSILKSLMDEEAKKKEKKLERNRDSARESRRKQQTYVETLENGIKRLQINRDLIRSYRWGVSGPGFGSLPSPNSPEMSDWKHRVAVVTGRTEAFSNIQNPANFQSLMRLNRQRCILAIHYQERERAVWKCFVFVGRQLAAMRTRVLEVQMLRTFSGNPLAMELDALLNLTADQKLQLQCHAQQMFNQEVVELTKLFKIFFALRNEALRLNILCPSLERHFREACSFDQLDRLLQWTENHRAVIDTDLCLDEV